MSDPFLIWPIVKPDPHADALYEKISNARAAMEQDPKLFGLRVQGVVVQAGLPILTHTIHWLEKHQDGHIPRRRDDLTPLEKEALIDLLDPNPSHHIQELMGFHHPPIKTPERYWITGDITREGILFSTSCVKRAGKDNDWAEAFRDEAEQGATALAEIAQQGFGLRMSSQVATLLTPDMPKASAHSRMTRLPILTDIFSRHMKRLSHMMPQSRPFQIFKEWHPPRHS